MVDWCTLGGSNTWRVLVVNIFIILQVTGVRLLMDLFIVLFVRNRSEYVRLVSKTSSFDHSRCLLFFIVMIILRNIEHSISGSSGTVPYISLHLLINRKGVLWMYG